MRLPWPHAALLLALLLPPQAARAGAPAVAIDVASRRSEIRAALLKDTPLGSTSAAVLTFLRERLLPKDTPLPALQPRPASGPSAEASPLRGVSTLQLDLGHYPNPSLLVLAPAFPFEQTLQAQWAFDKNDHLIELFLDRSLDHDQD